MKSVQLTPLVLSAFCACTSSAFAPRPSLVLPSSSVASSLADAGSVTTATVAGPPIEIDPKECVKLFGRLAEKYIMLDASGGLCCYSGCSDCEFRLPDGGYIMSEMNAARPKWIPCYEQRSQDGGKEHSSKWSDEIFGESMGR
mmetsp:Transcript_14295/g.28529  ORF Transcript_14295/g.28529 Transcript_14295/m.28529 type:complete len:143 (-) Transcript_14295:110-538(-)